MINRICKWLVFKIIYPICYHLGAFRKVNPKKVLFVENHSEMLSDNYMELYERLMNEGMEISLHFLRVSTSNWGIIILRSLKLIMDMSTAACVFINESNSVFGSFALRKETKLIQLWHASGAFKKWGYSVADKSFGDEKKELDSYSPHRNYSLVPVSGDEVCFAYEEAFGLPKEKVKPLGVSRTDRYFRENARQNALLRIEESGILIDGRKLILYAPTFRGNIKGARAPKMLDLELLYERFSKDYLMVIRQHPFVKEDIFIPSKYSDFAVFAKDEILTEDLLLAADILITDYSSIIFEYSLMQRPMFFFAYDLEEYYDERGFYYPYENFVPGPIVRTTEELVSELEHMDRFDIEKLIRFRQKYMSGCDGHSTKRILEEIFGNVIENRRICDE